MAVAPGTIRQSAIPPRIQATMAGPPNAADPNLRKDSNNLARDGALPADWICMVSRATCHDIYTIKPPGYLNNLHLIFGHVIFQVKNEFDLFTLHNIFL